MTIESHVFMGQMISTACNSPSIVEETHFWDTCPKGTVQEDFACVESLILYKRMLLTESMTVCGYGIKYVP